MGLLPTAKLSSQSDRQSGRQTSYNVAGTLYPDPMRTSTTSCRCTTVNITMCLTYPMSVWDTVTYHDVIMSHVTCHMHCSNSSDVKQSPALGEAHQAIQVSLNCKYCMHQEAGNSPVCETASPKLTSSSSENMSNVNDSHVRQMNWNAKQGNVHENIVVLDLM